MKLFVDDEREAPEGWDHAPDVETAIRRIATIPYDEISLDHDAGPYGTFQPVAYFISEKWQSPVGAPIIHVHSANPVGRIVMYGILNRFCLLANEQ